MPDWPLVRSVSRIVADPKWRGARRTSVKWTDPVVLCHSHETDEVQADGRTLRLRGTDGRHQAVS